MNILINRKLLEMLKETLEEYKIEKRLKNYFLLYNYQRVQMIRIAPIFRAQIVQIAQIFE